MRSEGLQLALTCIGPTAHYIQHSATAAAASPPPPCCRYHNGQPPLKLPPPLQSSSVATLQSDTHYHTDRYPTAYLRLSVLAGEERRGGPERGFRLSSPGRIPLESKRAKSTARFKKPLSLRGDSQKSLQVTESPQVVASPFI
ncbi:hypothetical protein J6590_019236 [Homalodisca vitripennis]|nr:hypothetical protein J6590_019236 [Homalodisca vitripennis]